MGLWLSSETTELARLIEWRVHHSSYGNCPQKSQPWCQWYWTYARHDARSRNRTPGSSLEFCCFCSLNQWFLSIPHAIYWLCSHIIFPFPSATC
ncbi:hypothetical protein LY78DRAFT_237408 [Colletotrichum sublineola]|nr:hypothetical protein LY78DRAFT_237408 [Colletotrichum sublineola]